AIMREYRTIMRRLINDPVYRERVNDFLSRMEKVEPAELNIVIDDADDEKFVRAAVGGQADMVVTNDRHLLDVGEMDGVHIVTPKEAWRHYEEEEGSSHEWESFVKGLGIGR
ncbi:MAG: PIN domain-containing protein, partial [Longimicrobiales bacterium]